LFVGWFVFGIDCFSEFLAEAEFMCAQLFVYSEKRF